MIGNRFVRAVLLVAVFVLAAACRRSVSAEGDAAQATQPDPEVPAAAFTANAQSTDVMFFWFDDVGGAHGCTRVDEIPPGARRLVRVEPMRPDLRPSGWVFLTDVDRAGPGGNFTLRAVASEQLGTQIAARRPAVAQAAPPPSPHAATPAPAPGVPSVLAPQDPALAPRVVGRPQVVLYGAEWCSACHRAAAWLREQHIPFEEKDIERDPAAAREMAERARAQGVPLGSIPIIDVKGRLLVGFDPGAIQRALAAPGV